MRGSRGIKVVTAALILSLAASLPAAAPRLPRSDAEVLERLPFRPGDRISAELGELRRAVLAAPADPVLAARLGRRYFELAMAEGDPRYAGYAQALLQRWPEARGTPAEILFLRGLLRQYRHDFAQALVNLALALQADPGLIEARAWRAAIFMVQADYAAAREECAQLADRASELQVVACGAYLDATTGKSRQAHEHLSGALARRTEVDPAFRLWILTRLAEMAWRAGDTAQAERHFRAALALGEKDNFLLAAYADLLLELRRPADAGRLLAGETRSDTLLLRLALAARAQGLPEAAGLARTLGERFSDGALRGERLHLQEEARYLLELKDDPRAALAAAAQNFRTQREPRDALVLLEAALAARDPAGAAPALQWLDASGCEGARLREVAARLRALPR